MSKLAKKVAIVTGGSGNIGRAIAEQLGRDGATVIVNYRQSVEEAHKVVAAIESTGGTAVAMQADISDASQVRRLFIDTVARFGRLDILVNNAGVGSLTSIKETSEDEFDQMFGVNTRGAFFAMQEAARRIADGGRILNISSLVTSRYSAGHAVYAASKAALEQFTIALAAELGTRGITVNTVSPGPILTNKVKDMLGNIAQAKGWSTDWAEIEKRAVQEMVPNPTGRLGQVEEVAALVTFLASPLAGYINGANIRVDGGYIPFIGLAESQSEPRLNALAGST